MRTAFGASMTGFSLNFFNSLPVPFFGGIASALVVIIRNQNFHDIQSALLFRRPELGGEVTLLEVLEQLPSLLNFKRRYRRHGEE